MTQTRRKGFSRAVTLGVSALGVSALGLALFATAQAAAPQGLSIVIRQQSQVVETLSLSSDNPWIDLSDTQNALITENGKTQVLKGPFHGRLNKAREALNRQAKVAEIAQVRTAVPTGMAVPQGVTVADLSFDGGDTQCLIGGSARLWRADAAAPLTLVISLVGGTSRTLNFAPGQTISDWPQAVPLKAGGEYILSQPDTPAATRKFTLTTPKGNSPAADKLADAGCVYQAKVAAEVKARAER